MISVTYRTAVRSTISLPSDWKRQQEQHVVFAMICFLCAFISLSEDKLLHLEENKKETKKWFNALGRSTPFGGTKFGLIRSISNVSENVKPLLVSLKAYSEAEKKDHAKSAKEFFGETNNWNENGYITTDGTKLDFSDHHEGAPGEHRYVDHRDTRGEAAVQVELERYYGGAKALLAQNEAFLKGITEALLLTLHHTRRGEQARRVWTDFNPRPPRGGRQRPSTTAMRPLEFQSTPPARGATAALSPRGHLFCTFQSTPPARGATRHGFYKVIPRVISIHAPREGGDPLTSTGYVRRDVFQSTPPARGATDDLETAFAALQLSIHAPREGGATETYSKCALWLEISIHAPREGGDTTCDSCWRRRPISIHAPREGGDTTCDSCWRRRPISIHAPREGGD